MPWHVGLPRPGIEPMPPALAGKLFTTSYQGSPSHTLLQPAHATTVDTVSIYEYIPNLELEHEEKEDLMSESAFSLT